MKPNPKEIMSPDPTPDPANRALANVCIDVSIAESAWVESGSEPDKLCERAALAAMTAASESNQSLRLDGAEVAIVLSNNSHVQDLNRDYRDIDKPTNVLSFASFEADELDNQPRDADLILGDVIVAYETVVGEAKAENKDLKDHLSHMIVHGVLHLLGYDHQTDEQADKMESIEIDVLNRLGISNPYEHMKLDPVSKGGNR